MSVQLRVSAGAFDRRTTMHPDTRLCLALVSAGLSALATLSPAARGAIVASLDDVVSGDDGLIGPALDMLIGLRDRVNAEADPEVALTRRIQESLFSKALSIPDEPAHPQVDIDSTVIALR